MSLVWTYKVESTYSTTSAVQVDLGEAIRKQISHLSGKRLFASITRRATYSICNMLIQDLDRPFLPTQ